MWMGRETHNHGASHEGLSEVRFREAGETEKGMTL